MNIYVQDELAEQVKQIEDLNVSAVCQEALRAEVAQRTALASLAGDMKRVEVYLDEKGGDVAFTATELAYDEHADFAVYLTKRKRIAIYDAKAQALHQFDSFDDWTLTSWRNSMPVLVARVAQALGRKHVIELDI